MNTKELFKSFNKLNVLIVGDVMIDAYMWGQVNRISPEAPVPVVSVNKKENRLGGAANVALNIQAMGARPILCSVIGSDEKSDLFLDLLRTQKLSDSGIIKSKKRITTVKTRIIGGNHQMMRVDEELETTISTQESNSLFTKIKELVNSQKVDVIIFEDYDKGCISAELIQKIVAFAKQQKIPTVVDPKKKNFMSYKGTTLFKPNLAELREGLKMDIDARDMKEIAKATERFAKEQSIEMALITLSDKGIYIHSKKTKKLFPAHLRDVTDVSGAGDTVVSIAALCLAAGANAEDIARLSNLAGGMVCEKVGVVPVNKEQLLNEAIRLKL